MWYTRTVPRQDYWDGRRRQKPCQGRRAYGTRCPFHPYQAWAAREFFRTCEWYAARRTTALISVADAMTDQLVAAGVAPREKFTTIYSGMEVEPFLQAEQHRHELRAALGYTDEHVVIGKIARLFHLKGHEYVLAAAREVTARHPQARFLFVGDGVLRAALERQATDAGIGDRVKFVGLVPPERVAEYIGAMDLVVHASLREGLARVLPQALIAARPVVSYDVDGAREVVLPGQTGYLLPPCSVQPLTAAISELVSDPAPARASWAGGTSPLYRSIPPRADDPRDSRTLRAPAERGVTCWAPGRICPSLGSQVNWNSTIRAGIGANLPAAARKQSPRTAARTRPADPRSLAPIVALASQEHIGPYRLLNIVKTGQTSQVWAVMSDRDKRRLAIKILLSDFRRDKEHLGYLKQEAVVGKTLDHPHVIKIFEFAYDQSLPYLVMEYFPAPNMKEIILQVREQVAYLMPKIIDAAADGLAYFNSQGWIHRDVKPDNFLIIQNGNVKLIDFALAQRKKGALGRLFGGRSKVQGTRSYMSPEQIRGEPLDERSDVYSFGCTIFHLVAGRPPYTGLNSNELLNKHLRAQIPALEVQDRNITPEFGALIRSTMTKDPKGRPESMGKFLSEFRSLSMFKKPPAPPDGAATEENAS